MSVTLADIKARLAKPSPPILRDGETALHEAARRGQTACLEALILKGADIEAKDNEGWTALHFAAIRGETACLEALLAKGADIEAKDNKGKTALDWAKAGEENEEEKKKKKKADAVHVLEAWQTAKAAGTEEALAAVREAAIASVARAVASEELRDAAKNGDLAKLEALLAAGADIEANDKKGNAALHLVAQRGHTACLEALLAAGADAKVKDENDQMPLALAVKNGHSEIVKLLLPLDLPSSELSSQDYDGYCYSWSHIAIETKDKYADCIEDLLKRPDVNVRALAYSKHSDGRVVIDAASVKIQALLRKALMFLGQYELDDDYTHQSATCVVVCGKEFPKAGDTVSVPMPLKSVDEIILCEGCNQKLRVVAACCKCSRCRRAHYCSSDCQRAHWEAHMAACEVPVALKFLRHREHFDRELAARRGRKLDESLVVGILSEHELDADVTRNVLKGLKRMQGVDLADIDYPYVLVMPRGDRTLEQAIQEENFAGRDFEKIRHIVREIAEAVSALHTAGLVHGDLKPRNIMRFGDEYRLIDLDAAVELRQEAVCMGQKTSTAFCPPELFADYEDGTSIASMISSTLPARKSFDMWSFGIILFELCTNGLPFNHSKTDNLLQRSDIAILKDKRKFHERIADYWVDVCDDVSEKHRLAAAEAKALIFWCLALEPRERPSSMRDVLDHAFCSGKAAQYAALERKIDTMARRNSELMLQSTTQLLRSIDLQANDLIKRIDQSTLEVLNKLHEANTIVQTLAISIVDPGVPRVVLMMPESLADKHVQPAAVKSSWSGLKTAWKKTLSGMSPFLTFRIFLCCEVPTFRDQFDGVFGEGLCCSSKGSKILHSEPRSTVGGTLV